jgi:hypothetical protein
MIIGEASGMGMENIVRIDKILQHCINEFKLNLSGFVVFTEAATGPYIYTPILAALAGAEKVYALTADSRYGTKEQVVREMAEALRHWMVAEKIDVIFTKTEKVVDQCDIITNSGFVRPIDRKMVAWMKPTAVVSLMWEPWEFRGSDVDLEACRERGILILGTDESVSPHSMYPYSGYLAMKLLFELGLEGYKVKTLLLGGSAGLGRSIHNHFKKLGMEVTWFSDMEFESIPYNELHNHFQRQGADYDALIVAEHAKNIRLLGENGLLTYEEIARMNPNLCIGIISGNVDRQGLIGSGLRFFPKEIQPFGIMSYQPYSLGPRPVIELYAAGLKVGEAMARARSMGMDLEEAKKFALAHSPAIDFNLGETR